MQLHFLDFSDMKIKIKYKYYDKLKCYSYIGRNYFKLSHINSTMPSRSNN